MGEEEDREEEDVRGRQRTRWEKSDCNRRDRTLSSSLSLSTWPSRSPSLSFLTFSSDESAGPLLHLFNLRFHHHSQSSSPSSSTSSSRALSASSTPALSLAANTLVSELWAGAWDLVTKSLSLTPDNALHLRSITRAQLVMLVHDINPFEDELESAVV